MTGFKDANLGNHAPPYDGDMNDAVRAFYDELADDYHLLYADWQASIERQSAALDRLVLEAPGPCH